MKKGRKGLAALLVMVMVITMMGGFNAAQKTEVNADEKTYYAGNPIITNMFTADPSAMCGKRMEEFTFMHLMIFSHQEDVT